MTSANRSNLDIEKLNSRFAIETDNQSLCFVPGPGNIPRIKVKNQLGQAELSIQGAYVLSWIPADEDEVIWVSEEATFAPGKSIRGGIPICWPWFGNHQHREDFPAHGFARTVFWQVSATRDLPSGETTISFTLDTSKLDNHLTAMWPYNTILEYHVTIGQTLTLELITHNESEQAFILSEALHTYFDVQDVTRTTVTGLEGKSYLDKTDNFTRKLQTGPVIIEAETDRVYLDTNEAVVIDTQTRKIVINKTGSLSTVVWNPWQEVAAKMGDLGKDGYLHMLCVETANAADNSVTIEPAEQHSLELIYSVQS
ncbi:MAG: D-hexose-6-phosphate mutarotase [Thioalkalispiraceae bacterium]|jgi:glucose-6-phosphate 1-epimerase